MTRSKMDPPAPSPRALAPHAPGWLAPALLAAATLAAYQSVRLNGFVFDDEIYLQRNPALRVGLTPAALKWAFRALHAQNWHPLTWISHMVDVRLFRFAPAGHHLVSLLLHVANSLLLWGVLGRLTGSRGASALVAGLFALHPLHVESVAWVAERKDVLSTLCWLAALAAYVSYVRRPGPARGALTALAFAASLLAKPMPVTFPFVLLLFDYWPLGRWRSGAGAAASAGRLVAEKLPLFALSAGSAMITFQAQRSGGAMADLVAYPVAVRVGNALFSYTGYLGKALWPARLAGYYPHPRASMDLAAAALAGAVLGALTVGALRAGRRAPYLAVGWLFYLGTLVPVIGLVQVGEQAMADRYTYVPLLGLFVSAAWGAADLCRCARARSIAAAAGVVFLAALAAATARQVTVSRSNLTLFAHAVEVTRDNDLALYNLGLALAAEGREEEAMAAYREAARIFPRHDKARNNLGLLLAERGNFPQAEAEYREALRANPSNADAHENLSQLLMQTGRMDEARAHHREANRLAPAFNAETWWRSADDALRRGDARGAVEGYRRALAIFSDSPEALRGLVAAHAALGQRPEADQAYRRLQGLDLELAGSVAPLVSGR